MADKGDEDDSDLESSTAGYSGRAPRRTLVEGNGRFKSKAMSFWNNLRNGWVIPVKVTIFSYDDPIWILGVIYHGKERIRGVRAGPDRRPNEPLHIREFLSDFYSRFWMTYRRGFPEMAGMVSDCGWGCMLRSGQMILAQALVCHILGREWRHRAQSVEHEKQERMVLRWFCDKRSQQCPFSIHNLVDLSLPRGRKAGQWYGPSQVSYLLRDAVEVACRQQESLQTFRVYVAQDCTVYKADVYSLLDETQEANGGSECALLVLVPVRLGGEQLNDIYFPCLQGLLSLDCCVGIIGGRPKHSLYFLGWQGEDLVYLDPHFCQEVTDMSSSKFETASFHCRAPRKMAMSKMDPSCTIGFFCRGRGDFDRCCKDVEEMLAPPMQHGSYPFFTFSSGHSAECSQAAQRLDDEMLSASATASGSPLAAGLATFHTAEQVDGRTDVVIEPALPPPEDVTIGDFVIVNKPSDDEFTHLDPV